MTDSGVAVPSLNPALLTVVVTTSPVVSHPSTGLIDAVLDSFRFAAGLRECPTLIVCDGFKLKSEGTSRRESRRSYRQGELFELLLPLCSAHSVAAMRLSRYPDKL